jgi:hypothetical protein
MRGVSYVVHKYVKGNAQKVLVGKPEAKRPLGRPKCRGDNNIKTDLTEMGRDVV